MRDFERRLVNELDRWPGVEHSFEGGKKHPRLVLYYGDETRFYVYPFSSSDRRGSLNALSAMRRMLRDMGAVPMEK